jgi:hypothetical protein
VHALATPFGMFAGGWTPRFQMTVLERETDPSWISAAGCRRRDLKIRVERLPEIRQSASASASTATGAKLPLWDPHLGPHRFRARGATGGGRGQALSRRSASLGPHCFLGERMYSRGPGPTFDSSAAASWIQQGRLERQPRCNLALIEVLTLLQHVLAKQARDPKSHSC